MEITRVPEGRNASDLFQGHSNDHIVTDSEPGMALLTLARVANADLT
jgi:hypothetical protein